MKTTEKLVLIARSNLKDALESLDAEEWEYAIMEIEKALESIREIYVHVRSNHA